MSKPPLIAADTNILLDYAKEDEIVVYWSAEEGCFLSEVPELPNLITDGTSREEALRSAGEMIDAYLETARRESWPVPKP